MNFSMIRLILSWVFRFVGLFMLLPCFVAIYYKEEEGFVYLIVGVCVLVFGYLLGLKKVKDRKFYAKEGFVTVALCWICISAIGAIPFLVTGEIPSVVDALFESVSGFSTTGASILNDIEALSYTSLFWRSFTHWIGGMGILVFIMAILPLAGGYNMHLMRAEVPGPTVGKMVPKVRQTAITLYGMYIVMTVVEVIVLMIAKVPLYEALNLTFTSAGTGGFAIFNDSVAGYSYAVHNILTVFVLMFGVNFNVYFIFMFMRKPLWALKNEEVRYYLIFYAAAVALICATVHKGFASFSDALHHTTFTVASIMTSTGICTVDYAAWPMFAQVVLILLMFSGGCAGSTAGGIKVIRIVLMLKLAKNEMSFLVHPRRVRPIRFDGRVQSKDTVRSVQAFVIVYVCILVVSLLLVSLNGFDFGTTFSSVVAMLNNTGPGIGLVGPTGNYSIFTPLSKVVFMFNMLAGRLELFPLLMLFWPATWRKWK